ncbi:MAG: quinone-dependent dihydroorotate dehydrogenase [Bacteroidales bacterium]
MYKIIRAILFSFSAETAHKLTFKLLRILAYIPFGRQLARLFYCYKNPNLSREVFGINFKNPIGLAAGLDKNGDYYNDLANFGFGFIEIGSVTPNPQSGNLKPRLFRLVSDEAIINRMGINNNGVKYMVNSLRKEHPNIIIGGNIAKGTNTNNDLAGKDYEKCFSLLYNFVDYFVLNVSCPNVENLTELQSIDNLSTIIDRILTLRRYFDDYRPIIIKLSPDISNKLLDEIIELALISGIDGIMASNTTLDREGLKADKERLDFIGKGGLSGAPLYNKSLQMVKYIHKKTNGLLPIIAVGGIHTPQQAKEMLNSGASLIQIYSSFIYEGPGIVKKMLKYIK